MSFGDPIIAFVMEQGRLRRLTLPGKRNKVSGFFSEESINFTLSGQASLTSNEKKDKIKIQRSNRLFPLFFLLNFNL